MEVNETVVLLDIFIKGTHKISVKNKIKTMVFRCMLASNILQHRQYSIKAHVKL